MDGEAHALAPQFLPRFLPGPDGGDPLFTIVVVLVIILVMIIGNLYLRLHALPERMEHRRNGTQLQLVAVLTLIALLTHNNIFWVAALLIAVVRLPDFLTPIQSIASSLNTLTARGDASAASLQDAPAEPEREV